MATDLSLYAEGDIIRLVKESNNAGWRVVLWRAATSAEQTAYSAKQVTLATHHTGVKQ